MPQYLRGFIKKSAIQYCRKTNHSQDFIVVKTRKYSNLKLNQLFLSCVCDVPIGVVCNAMGVSETFLKKYKKLLSIQRWPQYNLYYDECQFIQSQRLLYIEQLKQNNPVFIDLKFSEIDISNLIEVLEEINNFAVQYNQPGRFLDTEQKWVSYIVKALFDVHFECRGQKIEKNKAYLDFYLGNIENNKSKEEEIDAFVRDVLWTPIDGTIETSESQEEEIDSFVRNVLSTPIDFAQDGQK